MRRGTWLAALGSTVAAVVACARDDMPVSHRTPLAAAMARAGRTWPDSVRPEEQAFADLAEAAPSSAGFSFDSLGTLLVHVKESADAEAGQRRARSFVASGRVRSGTGRPTPVVVVPAQYTFGELAKWRDVAVAHAFGVSGVVSVDLDEGLNRISIGIDPSQAALRATLLAQLADWGIDTAAVVLRGDRAGSLTASAIHPGRALSRRTTNDVRATQSLIVGGLQMVSRLDSHLMCTLGFVANVWSTNYFVTASHCTSTMWQYDGAREWQNGDDTSPQIGAEDYDASGYSCGLVVVCRGSDAASFTFSSGVSFGRGLIAHPSSRSGPCYSYSCANGAFDWYSSDPYFYIMTTANPAEGAEVNKVGAKTGWTWGYVTHTCVDRYIDVNRRATCQSETNMKVNGGDSGSPVFMWYNMSSGSGAATDLVSLAGTIVAYGSTADSTTSIFSPFTRIVNDFPTGTWTVTAPTTLSTPSASGSVLSGGEQRISWSSVPGASFYTIYQQQWNGSSYYVSPLTTTSSTSFTASTLYATSYNGTSMPGSGTWVSYWVYAMGTPGLSAASTAVYFQTGTCSGRC